MNKYRAQPQVIDGQRFDSKREAARWGVLLLKQREGLIRGLQRQKRYKLVISGVLICTYVSDFEYEELEDGTWHPIVEDSKGFRTPVYQIKKRLMRAMLGIEIRET